MRKVKIKNLQVGKEYYVECGIWRGVATFVYMDIKENKTFLRFTFGETKNWKKEFGLYANKNKFKIYEKN